MLDRILPERIKAIIDVRLNPQRLYELRFRNDMPIVVNYGGKYFYLGSTGIVDNVGEALYSDPMEIEEIVVKATEFSLYAVNNQLQKGYVTIEGGVRIGVCGEVVREEDKVKTIKDFTSINVRIPHEIRGCALTACTFINDTKLRSALIVAPPGAGKTTVLRDLCFNITDRGIKNVLLVDERCEIAAVNKRRQQLYVGNNVDIISNCPKEFAFSYGIRSMRPDVIITDELSTEKDVSAALKAVQSGICVIASVHASNMDELRARREFNELLASKLFTRYVFLSNRKGPGTYENVYDAELKCIFYGT